MGFKQVRDLGIPKGEIKGRFWFNSYIEDVYYANKIENRIRKTHYFIHQVVLSTLVTQSLSPIAMASNYDVDWKSKGRWKVYQGETGSKSFFQ